MEKTLRINKINNRQDIKGYLFIAPWLLGFLTFQAWPILQSFYLSLTRYNIFEPSRFQGLENFKQMMEDPLFYQSLSVTFTYALFAVPLKLAFALLVAVILSSSLKNINLYRTVYYLPSILGSSVAISVLWKALFIRDGIINLLLSKAGIRGPAWLGDPDITLFTISLLSVWQFGSAMVIFLAGLKQVPKELYEASIVDGAGRIKRFLKITLPMITPMIFFNMIMQTINAFQEFTSAVVMFGRYGSPLDCALLYTINIYNNGFRDFEMGYASALAWVLLLIIGGFTLLAFKLQKYWVYYES